MSFRLSYLPDVFRPEESELTALPYCAGASIASYLPKEFPRDGRAVVVYRDRELTGRELDLLQPEDGDEVMWGVMPGFTAAGFFTSLLVSAIVAGASFGIQALTAKDLEKPGASNESPTYNFDGFQTTRGSGVPIPFIYGKTRMGGHLMQTFEKELTGEEDDGVTALHTQLGIGMGPIEAIEGVRIGGTPVEDIAGVEVDVRLGTSDQSYIEGFSDLSNLVGHALSVRKDQGPITVITQAEVQCIEVIFLFPNGLVKRNAKGGRFPMMVNLSVKYREFGSDGAFSKTFFKTVVKNTNSPYKSILRIPNLPSARYQVQVRRNSKDDDDVPGGVDLNTSGVELFGIQEVAYGTQAHTGLAHIGIRQIPSAHLNQVPRSQAYSALVSGANRIRIYTSENTYILGYSDNPVECMADFITNKEWGMGDRYTWANINLSWYFSARDYCNEQVSDGRDGFQKRATLNRVFDQFTTGRDILQIISRLCGVMVILEGTEWRFKPDRAEEMVWIAGLAEIEQGSFRYHYRPDDKIANRITGQFLNMENEYRREPHFEEYADLPQGVPVIDERREMFGATDPAQVARENRRFLLQNRLGDGEECDISAGMSAMRVTAGEVFGISVVNASIGIASGKLRKVDATGTVLTLDESVTLESGKTYEIHVQHVANDTRDRKILISTAAQSINEVIVADSNWSGTIAPWDSYALGELDSSVQKMRAKRVTLEPNFGRKITAIKYDEGVYSDDLRVEPSGAAPSLPAPDALPPSAEDIKVVERLESLDDGTLRVVVDVDWSAPVSAALRGFEVWYRDITDGVRNHWEFAGSTTVEESNFGLVSLQSPGFTYEVAVLSTGLSGRKGKLDAAPSQTFATSGSTLQPPNLAGLVAFMIQGTLVISVQPISAVDLGSAGLYIFKVGPPGSTWEDAAILALPAVAPRVELKSFPHGDVTVLAKAQNGLGNESAVAANFSITLVGEPNENVIIEDEEGPTWPGTRVGFTIDVADTLTLVGATTALAPQPRRYQRGRMRKFGPGAPNARATSGLFGMYTAAAMEITTTAAVTARADVYLEWNPLNLLLGTWQSQTGKRFYDLNFSWVGAGTDEVGMLIESRFSTVSEADLNTQAWLPHNDRGEVSMKWAQFRFSVNVTTRDFSAEIRQMKVTIDVPDKTRDGRIVIPSANSQAHTYAPTNYFVEVTSLQVSVLGGAEGDTARVTLDDEDGFTVAVYDNADALKAGTVSFSARGR